MLSSAELQLRDLRHEHGELARRLDEAEETLAALPDADDPSRRLAMIRRLSVFFTTGLAEHARWEEQGPHAIVERHAPGGAPLTAALRCEHEIMQRRALALDELAAADHPDVPKFTARAHELTGLVRAHLEVEDRVLVPLVEQAWRDFEREMHRVSAPHVPAPPP